MLLNLKQWTLNDVFKKQITDYFIGGQFSSGGHSGRQK